MRFIETWKCTREDWHPSYRINADVGDVPAEKAVKVTVYKPLNENYRWHIVVSGRDDSAMDQLFESKDAAICAFLKIMEMPWVARESLSNIGFNRV